MKKLLFACAGLAALTAAARPSVDPDKVKVGMDERHNVLVEYELAGSPAVVTVEFQTNTLAQGAGEWVKLGGDVVRTVRGDVNCLVRTTGAHSFVWKAARDWRDRYIADGRFRAKLTVWPTSAPPTWLVCGLEKKGDVRYYEDPDYIPGGLSNDLYKTHCLLMRKCPAAGVTWEMGAVLDSSNEMVPEEEQVHLVVLTEDYYVSVYETTQKQGLDVTGGNSSTTRGDTNPMTNVSLGELRGTWYTDTGAYGYCWPQDGHAVAPNSAIGRLRELTGLDDFDLPTEAQWEYACRAGERFMFANGKNGTVWDPRAICICSGDPKGYTVPQPVGSVAPNDWGIYDMQGNVQELCLDRYATGEVREATFATGWKGGVATVDPVGAREWMGEDHALQYIIRRGGHVGLTWSKCTASYNHESGNWWWNGSGFIGFRLVRPAVAK